MIKEHSAIPDDWPSTGLRDTIQSSRSFYTGKRALVTGAFGFAGGHLARALQKLDAYSKRVPMVASPSTAHLFIVAPMVGGDTLASLFSTHPPIPKRIERLTGRPPDAF